MRVCVCVCVCMCMYVCVCVCVCVCDNNRANRNRVWILRILKVCRLNWNYRFQFCILDQNISHVYSNAKLLCARRDGVDSMILCVCISCQLDPYRRLSPARVPSRREYGEVHWLFRSKPWNHENKQKSLILQNNVHQAPRLYQLSSTSLFVKSMAYLITVRMESVIRYSRVWSMHRIRIHHLFTG